MKQPAKIETRAQRALLAPKKDREPYWRKVHPGLHLGYRKAVAGAGTWCGRRWSAERSKYQEHSFGVADDVQEADGLTVLSFKDAQRIVLAWEEQERRLAEGLGAKQARALTVKEIVEDYWTGRGTREAQRDGVAKNDARSRLSRHVVADKVAATTLGSLKASDLRGWRERVEAKELAPGTVKRLANDFKAALNAAVGKHRTELPDNIAGAIKDGLATPEAAPAAARYQVLSDDEVRRLIVAARRVDAAQGWEGDLARLVVVLAATGARFSQVVKMAVADVQVGQGRLMVPTSAKGRGKKAARHTAVRVGPDILETLIPAVKQRPASAPLLERWRSKQIAIAKWERVGRGPWKNASELARPWAAIVEAAELPAETVPYALRHSSIVRGLRAGLPVRLVASLHDTSSAMIEAHYAAFIVDALDELAARAVVPLAG